MSLFVFVPTILVSANLRAGLRTRRRRCCLRQYCVAAASAVPGRVTDEASTLTASVAAAAAAAAAADAVTARRTVGCPSARTQTSTLAAYDAVCRRRGCCCGRRCCCCCCHCLGRLWASTHARKLLGCFFCFLRWRPLRVLWLELTINSASF